MRITSLLLAGFLVQTQAAPLASQEARISLEMKNTTVEKVLDEIEAKSDYSFLYNHTLINVDRRVSIDVDAKDIESVLHTLFDGTDVVYTIRDNQIILSRKESNRAGNRPTQEPQQRKMVSGTVVDASGVPVIGANIYEKGTTNGTITDMDGRFSLEVSPNSTLEISYIGYTNQTIKVGTQTNFNITLSEDSKALEEVVVVGYGTQKKVNLTGAISTVKMEDVIGNRPVGNTAQALEGAIPGLQVSRNNGKPGTTINMNVRGATSINDNTNGAPLVLVDNVPMDIDLLDPNDIESVTTLKDAAASAIYGARAAFGVILITTKQGKKDAPMRVTYNNNFSFSKPASLLDKVNPYQTVQTYADMGLQRYYGGQDTGQWLQFINEYNQGQHPEGYLWSDGVRYSLAASDVIDDMMAKAGFQQQHNISVSGGSNKATYTDIRYSDANTSTAVGGTSEWGSAGIWAFAQNRPSNTPLGSGYATEEGTELLPYGTPRNFLELSTPKINRNNNIRLLGRLIVKPIQDLEIIGEYSFNRYWASERTFNDQFDFIETITGERKTSTILPPIPCSSLSRQRMPLMRMPLIARR